MRIKQRLLLFLIMLLLCAGGAFAQGHTFCATDQACTYTASAVTLNALYAADTGAVNAYVGSPPIAVALANLQQGYFTTTHPNTGASTLNWSGTGIKNLTVNGATALVTGQVLANVLYYVIYDGTEWVLQNPSGNSGVGGGVTSVQYGVNTALTGAIIESYGLGFATPSQASQTVTIAANQASPSLVGVTTLSGVGGAVYTPCATLQKSESAADTNVLTCAPASAAGSYRIRLVISVSAATAATLGWTSTWTDANGNAQTPTNLSLFQSGTAAPALTFTTSAAGNYYGHADIDVNSAGTNIVLKLTFTGTSFAAKVTGAVERIL